MLRQSKYSHLFDVCLEKTHPKVAAHKKKLGVQTDIFLFQWLQCGFLNVLPLGVSSLVWDQFLLDGTEYFYRIGLAIFALLQSYLLSADYEEFIKIITCHSEKKELWNSIVTEKALMSTASNISISFDLRTLLHRLERENV